MGDQADNEPSNAPGTDGNRDGDTILGHPYRIMPATRLSNGELSLGRFATPAEITQYYRDHDRCPQCFWSQLRGGLGRSVVFPIRDVQQVSCGGCGWYGKVHDLASVDSKPPEPPEPDASTQAYWAWYRSQHRACPRCRGTSWGCTTGPSLGSRDNNRAWCGTRGCGWRGIVDDLCPAAPEEKLTYWQWYARQHAACPQCGGVEQECSWDGYVLGRLGIDRNRSRCLTPGCDWRGVRHDRVPEMPANEAPAREAAE